MSFWTNWWLVPCGSAPLVSLSVVTNSTLMISVWLNSSARCGLNLNLFQPRYHANSLSSSLHTPPNIKPLFYFSNRRCRCWKSRDESGSLYTRIYYRINIWKKDLMGSWEMNVWVKVNEMYRALLEIYITIWKSCDNCRLPRLDTMSKVTLY